MADGKTIWKNNVLTFVVLASVMLAACSGNEPSTEQSGETPSPSPSASSPSPTPSSPEVLSADRLEEIFKGVRGYTFSDAPASLQRSIVKPIAKAAGAPVVDAVVKRVAENGAPTGVRVAAMRFDVDPSKLQDFHVSFLKTISGTFTDSEVILNGLGVYFTGGGAEAVTFFTAQGDVVYAFSPIPNAALPVAEAIARPGG